MVIAMAISETPLPFVQVLSTAIAGFFFYLVLRVTGMLIAGMALHALWDAGLFTGLITDETYVGGLAFLLANIVMAIVLLVRRHHIGVDPAKVTNPSHA